MIPHEPRPRAAHGVFVLLLLACGAAACGRVPGQFEIVQNQQPQAGLLDRHQRDPLPGRRNARPRAGAGGRALRVPRVPAREEQPPRPRPANGPDGNQIDVHSFAVDITASKYGSLPPNVSCCSIRSTRRRTIRRTTPCSITAFPGRQASARAAERPPRWSAPFRWSSRRGWPPPVTSAASRTSMLVNLRGFAPSAARPRRTSSPIRSTSRSTSAPAASSPTCALPVRVRADEHREPVQRLAGQLRRLLQPERQLICPPVVSASVSRGRVAASSRARSARSRAPVRPTTNPPPAATPRAPAAAASAAPACRCPRAATSWSRFRNPMDGLVAPAGIAVRRPRPRLRRPGDRLHRSDQRRGDGDRGRGHGRARYRRSSAPDGRWTSTRAGSAWATGPPATTS